MFLLVQLPLGDLRPMIPGGMGRLDIPDWAADDPGAVFVRGFGKMATRNSKSYDLVGERAFADFNNAVRLKKSLLYHQQEWLSSAQVELRFRRLYFDGRLAGQFEFGFVIDDATEDQLSVLTDDFDYNIRKLSSEVLNLPLVVRSVDGAEALKTVGTCADALAAAYTAATTKQNSLSQFPVSEIVNKAVHVGHPTIHVRVSNDVRVHPTRDRREVQGTDGKLFITSADRSPIRNNVVVQLSEFGTMHESAAERAVRVLFSHMNALLAAEAHFLRVRDQLKLSKKSMLAEAVKDTLVRLEAVEPSGPAVENDPEFAAALRIFAEAYAGRPDQLIQKIEELAVELAEPSRAAKAGTAIKSTVQWLVELVIKTGVETVVKTGMSR